MNYRNYSLDFLTPDESPRGRILGRGDSVSVVSDPWAEAVRYYGATVLSILQEEGAKGMQDLFEATKQRLGTSDLQIDQLEEVILRMIQSGQIQVVRQGSTLSDSTLALAISR